MLSHDRLTATLPHVQPDDAALRLVIFGVRQMGAHGLDDAAAAHAFLTGFGQDFRRPLTLLRTLMLELSEVSSRPIQIAPWCCPRMTASEAALVAVLTRCLTNEAAAGLLLADLLAVRDASGPLATAAALATACADLGLPLG
ncbi:hypothetical protein SAMN06297144_2877 [Sphingomonas guangdongensis]|uniref:Uncharacterized protein n=1 Tax=Sphingomonas guangdongensis TaxID=1141890 RepID=A0A285R0W6_9SPHN|nr:DUF6628 family protein [Sphingomonas guangdongensis]SOB87741.1 hypothetical protein SAMN06297144_2877 [Sphingomonas guangdongensis]